MIYLIVFLFLAGLMFLYFRVANRYNIIDKPNERSSHTKNTIRGGGIIFLFAAIIELFWHIDFLLPVLGILIIGIISFLDDIYTLSNRIRLFFHILAVSIIFWHLSIFSYSIPFIILLYVLVIGIINAYNFMDGINGITGAYSLIVLSGLQYVNIWLIPFTYNDFIWLPILGCLVFLYFNFRKKAICFAGDVGSITIASWIIILLLTVILKTGKWDYILFLAVYGIDVVITIIHRLLLKQNIFKAHRLHLYQILVNEKKYPHLLVSTIYAILQLVIILLILFVNQDSLWTNFFIILVPLTAGYIFFKYSLIKSR